MKEYVNRTTPDSFCACRRRSFAFPMIVSLFRPGLAPTGSQQWYYETCKACKQVFCYDYDDHHCFAPKTLARDVQACVPRPDDPDNGYVIARLFVSPAVVSGDAPGGSSMPGTTAFQGLEEPQEAACRCCRGNHVEPQASPAPTPLRRNCRPGQRRHRGYLRTLIPLIECGSPPTPAARWGSQH